MCVYTGKKEEFICVCPQTMLYAYQFIPLIDDLIDIQRCGQDVVNLDFLDMGKEIHFLMRSN